MPSYRFTATHPTLNPSAVTEGRITYSMTGNCPLKYSIYMEYHKEQHETTEEAEPDQKRLIQAIVKQWPALRASTFIFLEEQVITQEPEGDFKTAVADYYYFALTAVDPAPEAPGIFLCVGQEEQNGQQVWVVDDNCTEEKEWRPVFTVERPQVTDFTLDLTWNEIIRFFTENPSGKRYLTIMYPVIYPDATPVSTLSFLSLYKTYESPDLLERDPSAHYLLPVDVNLSVSSHQDLLLASPAPHLPSFSCTMRSPFFSPKRKSRPHTATRCTLPVSPSGTVYSPHSRPTRLLFSSAASIQTGSEDLLSPLPIQGCLFPDLPDETLSGQNTENVLSTSEPTDPAVSLQYPPLDDTILPPQSPSLPGNTSSSGEPVRIGSSSPPLDLSTTTSPWVEYALPGLGTALLAGGVGISIAANVVGGAATSVWWLTGVALGAGSLACPFVGLALIGAACVVILIAVYSHYSSGNPSKDFFWGSSFFSAFNRTVVDPDHKNIVHT